jgi:hypothetical protein
LDVGAGQDFATGLEKGVDEKDEVLEVVEYFISFFEFFEVLGERGETGESRECDGDCNGKATLEEVKVSIDYSMCVR